MNKMDKTEFSTLGLQEAYAEAVRRVKLGAGFSVNLMRHSAWIDGRQIVNDGRFIGKDLEFAFSPDEMERLYSCYKRSIPSERTNRQKIRGTQFLALEFEELSDEDIMYGDRRSEAQAKLELYVLFSALAGKLKWSGEGWFWRSERDRDFVILKDWIDFSGSLDETKETNKK